MKGSQQDRNFSEMSGGVKYWKNKETLKRPTSTSLSLLHPLKINLTFLDVA